MQVSKSRHPLALLRRYLKLNQKQMAAVCGRSRSLVQQIELGRKNLPPEVAGQVAINTGVSYRWLVGLTPLDPMLSGFGAQYDRALFDAISQAINGQRKVSAMDKYAIWLFTDSTIGQLLRMVLGSLERNDFFRLAPVVAAQFERWQSGEGFGLSELLAKEIESARLHDTMRDAPRRECFTIESPKKLPDGGKYPEWLKPSSPGMNQAEYDKAKAGFDAPPKLGEVVTLFRRLVDEALERQFKDVRAVKRTPADEKADQLVHPAGYLMPMQTQRSEKNPISVHAAAESKQLQQLQEFIGLLDSYSVAPRSRKGEVLRLLQEHPAYEPCRHVFIEADRRIKKGGLGQRGMKTAEPEATHHKSLTLPTAKVSVNKKPVIVRKSSIRNAR